MRLISRRPPFGYTLIEVLIVVAISAMLYVGVVTIFSGQNRRIQFEQSMLDLQSKIQNYAGKIQAGTYPDATAAGYKCTKSPTLGQGPYFDRPGGVIDPATNQDCIFIGRAILTIPD